MKCRYCGGRECMDSLDCRETLKAEVERLNGEVMKRDKWVRHWWERALIQNEEAFDCIEGYECPPCVERRRYWLGSGGQDIARDENGEPLPARPNSGQEEP